MCGSELFVKAIYDAIEGKPDFTFKLLGETR